MPPGISTGSRKPASSAGWILASFNGTSTTAWSARLHAHGKALRNASITQIGCDRIATLHQPVFVENQVQLDCLIGSSLSKPRTLVSTAFPLVLLPLLGSAWWLLFAFTYRYCIQRCFGI